MMSTDLASQMRALSGYNSWANHRVLEAAGAVPEARLDEKLGASFDSVRGNLTHVLGAQQIWLARWQGATATWPQPAPLPDLRSAYDLSHTALREFIVTRSLADFASDVQYTDSRGNGHSVPLWQLVTQVVNHGTHHRGETGMLLASMGHSPGDMDFVLYAMEHLK